MNDNIVWRNCFIKLHGLQEALRLFLIYFISDSKTNNSKQQIYNKIKKSLSLITKKKRISHNYLTDDCKIFKKN